MYAHLLRLQSAEPAYLGQTVLTPAPVPQTPAVTPTPEHVCVNQDGDPTAEKVLL